MYKTILEGGSILIIYPYKYPLLVLRFTESKFAYLLLNSMYKTLIQTVINNEAKLIGGA